MTPSFAIAFVAGLLSFLSPCVLPLIPSYVGFLTGLTLEELEVRKHALQILELAAGHQDGVPPALAQAFQRVERLLPHPPVRRQRAVVIRGEGEIPHPDNLQRVRRER